MGGALWHPTYYHFFILEDIPEGNKYKLNARISEVKNVITINSRKLPNLTTWEDIIYNRSVAVAYSRIKTTTAAADQ